MVREVVTDGLCCARRMGCVIDLMPFRGSMPVQEGAVLRVPGRSMLMNACAAAASLPGES